MRMSASVCAVYRVIQEELPPLMELISEDILSKKCVYRITILSVVLYGCET
jgi:hypothetical protein